MSIIKTLNGNKKPIGVGVLSGLIVAAIAFLTMHLALADRFRAEGSNGTAIIMRLDRMEDDLKEIRFRVVRMEDRMIGTPADRRSAQP